MRDTKPVTAAAPTFPQLAPTSVLAMVGMGLAALGLAYGLYQVAK